RSSNELFGFLQQAMESAATLYTLARIPDRLMPGTVLTSEQQFIQQLAEARPGLNIVQVDRQLAMLRARKSPTELDLLRRAVWITAQAHRHAQTAIEPGQNEFE